MADAMSQPGDDPTIVDTHSYPFRTTIPSALVDPDRPPYIPEGWEDQGLCRNVDPDIFFPPDGKTTEGRRNKDIAARICRRCPVQDTCLIFAVASLAHDGVWGAATVVARRKMRKRSAHWRLCQGCGTWRWYASSADQCCRKRYEVFSELESEPEEPEDDNE